MKHEKLSVLVVDDEKSNLKILSHILKDEAKVLLAKDGAQALSKANQFLPDLILLDVVMPGMDGFEIIKQLKSEAKTRAIPVIFITALTDRGNEEKGLVLGASDYIQKPFVIAIVQARVRLQLQLCKQRKMLEQLVSIDPLTSLANRRKYDEVIKLEYDSAIRNKTNFSIAMIDVDNFKNFNDFYGHQAGDRALEAIAQVLSGSLRRPRDFVARYGGEEFIVLLPETDELGAFDIMETCRQTLENQRIKHEKARGQILTISIGGVSHLCSAGESVETLLKLADDMLYQAKKRGKNRVVWHEVSA